MPEIIYKFRSWSNPYHKRCLTENELYFSEPNEINDPFDFRIFLDYSLLDTAQKKRDYFTRAFQKIGDKEILNEFESVEAAMEFHLKEITDHPEEVQNYLNKVEENRLNRFRILCFSEIYDNILMWSHYADNHQGYCIGFDSNSFHGIPAISMGPVHYSHEYPKINPLEIESYQSIVTRCFTKALEWKYEKEFRVVKVLKKEERLKNIKEFSNQHLIKEVILGTHMTQQNAFEIGAICKKKKIPLFYMEKIPFKFQLRKIKINYK